VAGIDAALPQFEAAGAQVVGVSADAWQALAAWRTQNHNRHLQLSDIRRQMLPAYDAMITDDKHPMFRYPRRAYFIVDKNGIVRFAKVMPNSLDLLDPQEILATLKASGA